MQLNEYPLSPAKFEDVPFEMYSQLLPAFYWLDSTFTVSYRFVMFPSMMSKKRRQYMEIIHADDPVDIVFDYYFAEYAESQAQLFITFLGKTYRVENMKRYYGDTPAVILTLWNSDGYRSFYAAASNPFDPGYRRMYGVDR